MYTPFEREEAYGHRKDSIEMRLREGSPVVGVSITEGVLLLTVRRSQRKIYEIYDRQMFSAIGMQADIENVRVRTIQMAHQEGFERSPDDVTLHRLVGFSLSPALKQAFGDMFSGVPFVIRALFAEIGRTQAHDQFFTLNYDGEFRVSEGVAVIAGSQAAEDKMLERLGEPNAEWTREEALAVALKAWGAGMREALRVSPRRERGFEDDEREAAETNAEEEAAFLRDELKTGTLEAGFLERNTNRESRFRLLTGKEFDSLLGSIR
jgi:proteasome alpha subunit